MTTATWAERWARLTGLFLLQTIVTQSQHSVDNNVVTTQVAYDVPFVTFR